MNEKRMPVTKLTHLIDENENLVFKSEGVRFLTIDEVLTKDYLIALNLQRFIIRNSNKISSSEKERLKNIELRALD